MELPLTTAEIIALAVFPLCIFLEHMPRSRFLGISRPMGFYGCPHYRSARSAGEEPTTEKQIEAENEYKRKQNRVHGVQAELTKCAARARIRMAIENVVVFEVFPHWLLSELGLASGSRPEDPYDKADFLRGIKLLASIESDDVAPAPLPHASAAAAHPVKKSDNVLEFPNSRCSQGPQPGFANWRDLAGAEIAGKPRRATLWNHP
jgi:hypothetical protein